MVQRLISRQTHFQVSICGNGTFESRQLHGFVLDPVCAAPPADDVLMPGSVGPISSDREIHEQIGWSLRKSADIEPESNLGQKDGGLKVGQPSDIELMKERFAKLLLGEDMSGGGRGVSSALALSNAITNLAASVFGEQGRLEPMSEERKARWRKEIDWLLSVTDYIVELVPSRQMNQDGSSMEIMVTRQRKDLNVNMPALRKLDTMLIECLDNFKDHNEFWYVSPHDEDEKENGDRLHRHGDKWWLPKPKVPPDGLSDNSRKRLQFQDCLNQVLKASMAINAQVLSEMEIPEDYIESLQKNGRECLGDSIYRSITTTDYFDPDELLSTVDLSTEHKILDLKNKVEASVMIWQRKMLNKDQKTSWGSTVSMEKREQLEDRAETILILLKQRFPGIPQSTLDISKIQENRDIGQSVIESYSRILESLAFTVMSRIDDVLYADSLKQNPSLANQNKDSSSCIGSAENLNPTHDPEELELVDGGANAMTLSDFMGWHLDQDSDTENEDQAGEEEGVVHWKDDKPFHNATYSTVTNMVVSCMENLEHFSGFRSHQGFS